MTDPVTVSQVRRGLPWRCGRGHHKWVVLTAVKVNGRTTRTLRCRRCPATMREET